MLSIKTSAFSLAEMLVVMLILCVMLAAAAPIITKRATAPVAASSSVSSPVGTIIAWPSVKNMPGGSEAKKWLVCDGSLEHKSDYPDLYKILVDEYSAGGTDFYLPNYAGAFLRGYGVAKVGGVDHASQNVGVVQNDAMRAIKGSFGFSKGLEAVYYSGAFANSSTHSMSYSSHGNGTMPNAGGLINFDSTSSVPTDVETRPVNVAVVYLIKALP